MDDVEYENVNCRKYSGFLEGNYYFCSMIRSMFFLLLLLLFSGGRAASQTFISTSDLFERHGAGSGTGKLKIIQNPSIDTLLNRYIRISENIYSEYGRYGMEGFRIQIYSSSNRNAREESNKVRAEFMSRFPDIVSYPIYAEPGYFKIRAGDFRTRTEAAKLFQAVSKVFPDAYLVPDIINFPDQIIK